jgi:hypothetical protein
MKFRISAESGYIRFDSECGVGCLAAGCYTYRSTNTLDSLRIPLTRLVIWEEGP